MASPNEKELRQTTSSDGTKIGYWVSGQGPPLVLVNGPFGNHTRWEKLVPHLESKVTVCAMDRRGRGASEDAAQWAIEREYEDVAAVVDDVFQFTDQPVNLYGHSGGGMYAFGAAALTSNIEKLILYEGWPPIREDTIALPSDFLDRMDGLVDRGKYEELVELVFLELVGVTEEELETIKQAPSWAHRVDAAPTGPRELRAIVELRFEDEAAAKVDVPTLLLYGDAEDGHPLAREVHLMEAALPNARSAILEGEAHEADITAPEAVASHVLDFIL